MLPSKNSRRRVLKSGAGIIFTSNLIPKIGSAKSTNRYVGVMYDPQTAEIKGQATGQINERHENLVGNIELGEMIIPLNENAVNIRDTPDGSRSVSRFESRKRGDLLLNNRPMKLRILSPEGQDISGIVDYGIHQPKRAFRVRKASQRENEEEIIQDITDCIQEGERQ